MAIKEIIDEIERLAYNDNKTLTDIIKMLEFSRYRIKKELDALKLEEPERHEALMNRLSENAGLKQIELNLKRKTLVNFKERLDKIEPLIWEGKTLNELAKHTDLTKNQIWDTIKALNRPKTDIYDEKKYTVLIEKIRKNGEESRKQNARINEKDYGEYLDKIEYYINNKCLVGEICESLHLSDYEFHKIVNALNVEGEFYNPKRYERIKKRINQNAIEIRIEKLPIPSNINDFLFHANQKLEITKKVAIGEISVFEAANLLNLKLFNYFLYILKLKEEELKNSLRIVLEPYGVFINENSPKSLQSKSLNAQREIVLMALTYRVSYKTVARMFGVSLRDVIETFKTFDDYMSSLECLFFETWCESEIFEKKAKENARNYWNKRNVLVNASNNSSKKIKQMEEGKEKEIEEEKLEEMKRRLKDLRIEVYDTFIPILKCKNARDYTEEEQDLIARYVLKYYYSFRICGKQLGIDRTTFSDYIKSLAARDPIFAEKINYYESIKQNRNDYYLEQNSNEISRGGGSK